MLARLPAALAIATATAIFGSSGEGMGQELEVRAYTNIPVGVNVLQFGYGRSTGNILVDPSLPVEGLNAKLNLGFFKYARTFDFLERLGTVTAFIPFTSGNWKGVQTGVGARTRDIKGLADARFTLGVNFVGAPALRSREFRTYRQKTIVGTNFQVIVPTGRYDETKLINLGANRWGFKPEIGVSHAIGRWHLEAAGTVWLFTENRNFLGGFTVSQDPLYAVQGHVVYSFRPGFWASLNMGYANGGTTTVDGVVANTLQNNLRAGVSLQYPFARRHGLRIAFNRGVTTRIGADFDSLVIGYQLMWGGGT
jgi:hypothetical protein